MSEWQGTSPSRRTGRSLAQALRAGTQPQPIRARVHLEAEEFCVAELPVTVHQLLAGDGSYTHKSGGYIIGSSVAGAVLGGAFSAARFAVNVTGNQLREWRAARDAALQWRPVDAGRLYLTNRRFAIQGAIWTDLWFRDIRLSGCDSEAIELHATGESPIRFEIPEPDYWFVLFNKLAFDTVVDAPEPIPAGPHPASSYAMKPKGPPSRPRTSAELAHLLSEPPPEAAT